MTSENRANYHDVEVDFTPAEDSSSVEASIHYVEAGSTNTPTILLLHGYPASSHQYRDLIPMLSDKYHVLAPDYPGFGLSRILDGCDMKYTFENLTLATAAWLRTLNITEAAIFIQDFGAPVGLRLAITGALKVTAVISQNGNAYEAGLGAEGWGPVLHWWKTNNDPQIRQQVSDAVMTLEGTRAQWTGGLPDSQIQLIDPMNWVLAYSQNIAGPEKASRMLDLFYDYRTNVALYPEFHKYFRESKVPILAVWGKHDLFFPPAGAEAFREDCPDAEVHILDAGHFALETQRWEIAKLTRRFLERNGL